MSDSSVQELPEDFGKLQSLVVFDGVGCSSLSRLSESVHELANLEILVLRGCDKLQSLPTSIGGVRKLRGLSISESGVQEFPEDFGKLQSLVHFDGSGCSSSPRSPESLG